MWGTKKHGLVLAGMTFEPCSEPSGGRTTGTATFYYRCQCGQTYGTRLTLECASEEELENLVCGAIAAVQAGFSRIAQRERSQDSSTNWLSALMSGWTRKSE